MTSINLLFGEIINIERIMDHLWIKAEEYDDST